VSTNGACADGPDVGEADEGEQPTVPREAVEPAGAHDPEEEFQESVTDDGGDGDGKEQVWDLRGGDVGDAGDFKERCADNCGHGKEKAEGGGSSGFDAAKEAEADGAAGTGEAGQKRDGLGDADDDGVGEAEFSVRAIETLLAGEPEQFAVDEEHDENEAGGSEELLDDGPEQYADEQGGYGGEQDAASHAEVGAGVPGFSPALRPHGADAADDKALDCLQDVAMEDGDNSAESAEVQGDFPSGAGGFQAEQCLDEYEVTGAADGKELRDSLHDGEEECVEERHARYFPMQKLANIRSSISSTTASPVISLSARSASAMSSARRSMVRSPPSPVRMRSIAARAR